MLFTGPATVHSLKGVEGDNGCFIAPGGLNTTATASTVIFYVETNDAESATSSAVNISPKSTLKANVVASNGTVYLHNETIFEGAIFAKAIYLDGSIQVTMNTAFKPQDGIYISSKKAELTEHESMDAVPDQFALDQNYPNPFNPTTQIRYALPQQSHVTLTIYNMLGQEVARIVDAFQREGFYEVQWNGRNSNGVQVSTGIYLYRITAGSFVQTRKMILLK